MKNTHILPTDKPSRLYIDNKGKYNLEIGQIDFKTFQNIYITSDVQLKDGEYGLAKIGEIIKFHSGYDYRYYAKIILTTDHDLIKNGIQAIDDEFLEWFIKNPSCEEVKIEQEILKLVQSPNYVNHTPAGDGIYLTPKNEDLQYGESLIEDNIFDYKIIIPQEKVLLQSSIDGEVIWGKPKQETLEQKLENILSKQPSKFWEESDKRVKEKESLEEVAKKYDGENAHSGRTSFIAGAKWQAEQDKNKYSEEEVLELVNNFEIHLGSAKVHDMMTFKKWFEQHKKK